MSRLDDHGPSLEWADTEQSIEFSGGAEWMNIHSERDTGSDSEIIRYGVEEADVGMKMSEFRELLRALVKKYG